MGEQNEYPWTFSSKPTPNSLEKSIAAGSKTSTMVDILLQKPVNLKLESRKSFT